MPDGPANNNETNWHERSLEALTRSQILISQKLSEALFTPVSLAIHTVWFVGWLALGLDINLLTLIVSLEAIYITLFIGVGQKLQDSRSAFQAASEKKVAEQAEAHREQLSEAQGRLLQVNTDLTEQVARLTQQIHRHLGIDERG